jgi:hypothetical protein
MDQIDSGHELAEEERQEFPGPAKQANQHGSYSRIEHVVSRVFSAIHE